VPEPSEMIFAPWSEETVAALSRYQDGPVHPYTCPNEHQQEETRLVATPNGWVCSDDSCAYAQNWAHAASLGDWEAAIRAVLPSATFDDKPEATA